MTQKLDYEIHSASSYTGEYLPKKILDNQPSNSSSRWTTETNDHPQFIVLKLLAPRYLRTITFGKFEKVHVCNVKKFEIYGGLDEKCSVKLHEGTLRNDTSSETFTLRNTVAGREIPVLFVKIVPLQSWGSSFSYSIWYIELRGAGLELDNLAVMDGIEEYRQQTALKMCLKFFRTLGLHECYRTLMKNIKAPLEHPVISRLYTTVVEAGDFGLAEQLMITSVNEGYMNDFVSSQKYAPFWQQIKPLSCEPFPGMRGGHQMVLDSATQLIYLFGGWDGSRNLSDFWKYDIAQMKWTLISHDTEENGGPTPRSCHKMFLFPDEQLLFVIGRYVDQPARSVDSLKNDFYMYNIQRQQWFKISDDTAAEGGPRLLFDHQLAMDCDKKVLYVFGGRIIENKNSSDDHESTFSGLYHFHVPSNTWKCLQPDVRFSQLKNATVKPRIGHCVIFHPVNRLLYIFGGHYHKEPIKDMIAYDVDRREFTVIGDADTGDMVPVGFTQRATLDVELNEIYVYFGVLKDRDNPDDGIQNTLWICDVTTGKWSMCYNSQNRSGCYRTTVEPMPRYAHQLVYDSQNKVHFLFGGNPTRSQKAHRVRLDDFWKLKLLKPKGTEIIRKARYILRKQQFRELCSTSPVAAVSYLQREIREVVDVASSTDLTEFHHLPSCLFGDTITGSDRRRKTLLENRNSVFEDLCQFFPEDMVPPRQNLIDLIKL